MLGALAGRAFGVRLVLSATLLRMVSCFLGLCFFLVFGLDALLLSGAAGVGGCCGTACAIGIVVICVDVQGEGAGASAN